MGGCKRRVLKFPQVKGLQSDYAGRSVVHDDGRPAHAVLAEKVPENVDWHVPPPESAVIVARCGTVGGLRPLLPALAKHRRRLLHLKFLHPKNLEQSRQQLNSLREKSIKNHHKRLRKNALEDIEKDSNIMDRLHRLNPFMIGNYSLDYFITENTMRFWFYFK